MKHPIFLVTIATLAAAGPAAAQAPAEGAPRVHVETNSPEVTLFERPSALEPSRPLCRAPCDRVVDGRAGQSFYFAGDGIAPSPIFQLSDRAGDLRVRVDARAEGNRAGGIVMTVLGSGGVVGSLGLLLFGRALGDQSTQKGAPNTMLIGGGVLMAASVGLLVGGIVTLATNSRTRFKIAPASATAGGAAFVF
jgi:hypothetical protein